MSRTLECPTCKGAGTLPVRGPCCRAVCDTCRGRRYLRVVKALVPPDAFEVTRWVRNPRGGLVRVAAAVAALLVTVLLASCGGLLELNRDAAVDAGADAQVYTTNALPIIDAWSRPDAGLSRADGGELVKGGGL